MTEAHTTLIDLVERLKIVLVARATGGYAEDLEYRQLRDELLGNKNVADSLPRLVKTYRSLDEFWDYIQPKFSTYAERREYLRNEFEPALSKLENCAVTPGEAGITEVLEQTDCQQIYEVWSKALDRKCNDPDGAITSARTLLEQVCKHILDVNGDSYDTKADLPKLYHEASKLLNLAPSQHTEIPIKQVLGGCKSVVEGLGCLRSRLGDAHAKQEMPSSHHAELAVNMAGAMAAFMISVWNDQDLVL